MDQTQLQQNIAEYYEKLPPEAQSVFASMQWMETLKTISSRYALTEDQIATLGTETTLVLLGIVHPDEYEKTIIKELGIQADTTNKILDEIDEKVLKPIRTLLHETFIQNANELVDPEVVLLPDSFQEPLLQSDYKEKIAQIATTYNIAPDKIDAFRAMALKFITNVFTENQLQGSLILATNMEVATAKAITADIATFAVDIRKKADEYAKEEAKNDTTIAVPLPPYANQTQPKEAYRETVPEIPAPQKIETKVEVPTKPINTSTSDQKNVFSGAGIEMVGRSSHDTPEPAAEVPKKIVDPYHEAIE